ncbi:hypothetical protein CYMTET_13152 [Cymbomonas tetramitiformis]|uniref:Retrovirus-related Pol polyprotein from transposon TNT 1-94-like beta-barrel domain-containing protein n=1 Tax=Cymbomonas tetramitiformis TaxID=36881 RepID=A0AAE0LBP3_9CHLO|nr:hypothetical protein CYMTET_13152 [Cymbomonas tetramitiformis]
MMAGTMAVLQRARGVLNASPCLGVEDVDDVEDIEGNLHIVRGIVEHIDKLMQLEPVVVRTSFENLQEWASGLGQTTRALLRAVDLYVALLFGCTDGASACDHCPEGSDAPGYIPAPLSSDSDSDSGESLPDLVSSTSGLDSGSLSDLGSGTDSGDDGDIVTSDSDSDSLPDLESDSGSDEDCDPLPYGGWADVSHCVSGIACVEVACGAHSGGAVPSSAGGKSAVLDSGATRHIFNSMAVFNGDYDPMARETFKVVQSDTVTSSGSGSVAFAKTDVCSGRLVGLRLLGVHCIPGQSFNLISVVALEDAGFKVDFEARTVSKGAEFCFARNRQSVYYT